MLSEYHEKYRTKPDEELARRIDEKEKELILIKEAIHPEFRSSTIEIAVMGCGDGRFVQGHREIFSKVFDKPVMIHTYDITIDHLVGEDNVFQHNCTEPLPYGPYDITFAHVLLRFIPKDSQWKLVQNSYNALKPGGVAIHVLDPEDYESTELADLPMLEKQLADAKIQVQKVSLAIGMALVLLK